MDAITSTEFRKRYAKLTEPTAVTVNGHRIGIYRPEIPQVLVFDQPDKEPMRLFHEDVRKHGPLFSPQAKRDELLRKINRK